MQIYPVNSTPFSQNIKPKTGKKTAVGLSSFIVPGLGQAVNNQWGKGALFLAGTTAIRIPARKLVQKMTIDLAHNLKKAPEQAWNNLIQSKDTKKFALALLGMFAIQLISVVDAVKNTKADVE